MAGDNGNPFDAPLASEVQDHQQSQAATVQASSNGNPFDEPLMSEKAEAATAPQSKNFDVGAALGGMHGGSYDIAFRDPKGQISPDTIKAEAVGGAAGIAADGLGAVVPAAIAHLGDLTKIVKAAKDLGWASFGLKEAHDLYKMVNGDKK